MCQWFICCYSDKPAVTVFLGTLANLPIRPKVSSKVEVMPMGVFTDTQLQYFFSCKRNSQSKLCVAKILNKVVTSLKPQND